MALRDKQRDAARATRSLKRRVEAEERRMEQSRSVRNDGLLVYTVMHVHVYCVCVCVCVCAPFCSL